MAYIENTFKSGYKLGIEWTETDPTTEEAISSNSTTVTFSVYLQSTGSSYYINSTASKTVTLTIDGTAYTYSAKNLAKLAGKEKKILYTKTLTITHDDDGSKSVTISASFGIEVTLSGTFYDTVYCPSSGTHTAVLGQIPRPSTATLSVDTAVIGQTVTIYTNRASASLTHNLYYSADGGESFAPIAANVGESCNWVVPSAIADANPNKTSGLAILRTDTYNGGVLTGTRRINFPFSLSSSDSAPTISSLSPSQTNSAEISLYIAGKSTLTLTAIASLKYEATASHYTFTINGTSYVVQTSSAIASKSILIPQSWSGSIYCSVTVTDSRGMTSSVFGRNITVTAYSPPIINDDFEVVRGTGSGSSFVVSSSGTRIRITATGTVTSLSGYNKKSYYVQYKYGSGSYSYLISETTLGSYGLDLVLYPTTTFSTTVNYTIKFTVVDSFGETSEIITVRSKGVLMNFGADGNSWNLGGKATYTNAGEITQPVHLTGGIVPTILASSVDLNDYTAPGWYYCPYAYSITNAPSNFSASEFGLEVHQYSYSSYWQKLRYASSGTVYCYVRYCEGGSWQAWKQTDLLLGHLYIPNISGGGSTGSVPYQQSSGKLAMLAPPTSSGAKKVLVNGGGTTLPQWEDVNNLVTTDPAEIFGAIGEYIVDLIYPVGSIYISVNSVDPSALFGGTWSRIEDKFLLASGSTYAGGNAGGAASYTIPAHRHLAPIGYKNNLFGVIDFTSDGNGSKEGTSYGYKTVTATTNSTGTYSGINKVYTQYNAAQTVPTLPPYLAVYVWQRIS